MSWPSFPDVLCCALHFQSLEFSFDHPIDSVSLYLHGYDQKLPIAFLKFRNSHLQLQATPSVNTGHR